MCSILKPEPPDDDHHCIPMEIENVHNNNNQDHNIDRFVDHLEPKCELIFNGDNHDKMFIQQQPKNKKSPQHQHEFNNINNRNFMIQQQLSEKHLFSSTLKNNCLSTVNQQTSFSLPFINAAGQLIHVPEALSSTLFGQSNSFISSFDSISTNSNSLITPSSISSHKSRKHNHHSQPFITSAAIHNNTPIVCGPLGPVKNHPINQPNIQQTTNFSKCM